MSYFISQVSTTEPAPLDTPGGLVSPEIRRNAGVIKKGLGELFPFTAGMYPFSNVQKAAAITMARTVECGDASKDGLVDSLRAANRAWLRSEFERVPIDFSGEQVKGRAPMQAAEEHSDSSQSANYTAAAITDIDTIGLAIDLVNYNGSK